MREELVELAAKFLLNPTVARSPISHRRSFLEKKGLTSDEIDEAFRRVPDTTPSSVTPGRDINSNQDVQPKPFAAQSFQPLVTSTLTATSPHRFSWSYVLFSLVLLILSGAGTFMLLMKFFLPRLKSWICKIVLEEDDNKGRNSNLSLSKDVIEAAKAAAAASANAAKASLEMLQSKKEERHLDVLVRHLDNHTAELRSMNRTIRRLEGAMKASYKHSEQYIHHNSQNGPDRNQSENSVLRLGGPRDFVPSAMKFRPSGKLNSDDSVMASSAPLRPSSRQHLKSYMKIMAMMQRGGKPPGIKDIDDSPPNPDQPLPNPRITPRVKPWEIAQPQNNLDHTSDKRLSQPNGENVKVQPWWKRNIVPTHEGKPEIAKMG